MSKAWTFQKPSQVRVLGADKAPHYVGWYEPDGRRKAQSCGVGFHGKKNAERLARKLEAELIEGTYQIKARSRKPWREFVEEYDRRVLTGLAGRSQYEALAALRHFQRIIKPIRVSSLSARHIADFIAARRQEGGIRKGELLSPATINKDLRHVKAALNMAREWGYLPATPKIRMEKVPEKVPTYVPPEHFAAIYQACEIAARWPEDQNYSPAYWWRALIVMAYMTGWRISALLALRRDDVDLGAGTALSRAKDNKGKRDQLVPLHPMIVEHLKRLPGFSPMVFPWGHGSRRIFSEFDRIQKAAGICLKGRRDHYGFHDLRRAFATMNAGRLTPDALQALMQHKDYQTTQKYIAIARQLNPAVEALYVPDLVRKAVGR
jgi:integrase